jgi:hypothetical protein
VVAADGHPVTGTSRFRVTAAADGPVDTGDAPAGTGEATAGVRTSLPPPLDAAVVGRAAGARDWGFPGLLVGALVLSGAARWRVARRRVRS